LITNSKVQYFRCSKI